MHDLLNELRIRGRMRISCTIQRWKVINSSHGFKLCFKERWSALIQGKLENAIFQFFFKEHTYVHQHPNSVDIVRQSVQYNGILSN